MGTLILAGVILFVIIFVVMSADDRRRLKNGQNKKPEVDLETRYDEASKKFFELQELDASKSFEAVEAILPLISRHRHTLYAKYRESFHKDDYGLFLQDSEQWESDIEYFYYTVLAEVSEVYPDNMPGIDEVLELIMEQIEPLEEADANTVQNVDQLDPLAFETFCCGKLIDTGWQATTTKRSGDQGIDIIATRGNIRAVLQCKQYSSPVGNSAVQEIHAGKALAKAHIAIVVSNASYTPAAKELASATNVYLLHYSDLNRIDNLIPELAVNTTDDSEEDFAVLTSDQHYR